MKQITTSKGSCTIADMSEVVAKYMGLTISSDMFGNIYSELADGKFWYLEDFPSWDFQHDIWHKVKNQKFMLTSDNITEMKWHRVAIETAIINNEKEIAFKNLYDCIKFINQLKQQNNANKSI